MSSILARRAFRLIEIFTIQVSEVMWIVFVTNCSPKLGELAVRNGLTEECVSHTAKYTFIHPRTSGLTAIARNAIDISLPVGLYTLLHHPVGGPPPLT